MILSSLLLGATFACGGPTPDSEPTEGAPMADTGITQLQIVDTRTGTGDEARPGRLVRVHYTGWLYDTSKADKKSSKFDSSKDRNDPFEFPLGGGQVIPGWDQGFAGMKVGGTRVLTIRPDMGYGARGAGGVIPLWPGSCARRPIAGLLLTREAANIA